MKTLNFAPMTEETNFMIDSFMFYELDENKFYNPTKFDGVTIELVQTDNGGYKLVAEFWKTFADGSDVFSAVVAENKEADADFFGNAMFTVLRAVNNGITHGNLWCDKYIQKAFEELKGH